jgi:hypothetical protein
MVEHIASGDGLQHTFTGRTKKTFEQFKRDADVELRSGWASFMLTVEWQDRSARLLSRGAVGWIHYDDGVVTTDLRLEGWPATCCQWPCGAPTAAPPRLVPLVDGLWKTPGTLTTTSDKNGRKYKGKCQKWVVYLFDTICGKPCGKGTRWRRKHRQVRGDERFALFQGVRS